VRSQADQVWRSCFCQSEVQSSEVDPHSAPHTSLPKLACWIWTMSHTHIYIYIHTYHAINLSPQHSIQRRKLQSGKRPLSHMSGNTLKTQQEQNATWKNETMPNLALCSICAELIKQTYPWHNFNPFAQHKRLYAASSCDALRCSFITAHRPRHVKTSCSDVKTHCFSVCCLRV
jgi:hypothetical protein